MEMKNYTINLLALILLIFSTISWAEISQSEKELLENLPPDQRDAIQSKMEDAKKIQKEIDEVFEEKSNLIERPELKEDYEDMEDACEECIYGYNIFRFAPSTFSPLSTSSAPESYTLGPGDKLEISYYGSNEEILESYISRAGIINLPLLGPMNLAGLSLQDAIQNIRNKVKNQLIGTDVSVSLIELRAIKVYLLGEAYKPGLYTLSALSNVTNALFISGGVNEQGSLRNIEIKRNNQIIGKYDFYDFLLRGSLNTDLALQNGDVIFIPFIENKVKMGGSFKRPRNYEFLKGETISDAIELSGGYRFDVQPKTSIELSTIDQETFSRIIINIPYAEKGFDRQLKNGDVINVSSISGIEPETINISGQVRNPGDYSIQQGDTILDLLNKAGGYMEDSYPEGAVFLRKRVAEVQKEAFLRSADQLEKVMIDAISNGDLQVNSEFSLSPITKLITKLRESEPLGRQIVDLDILNLKTDPYLNFMVRGGDSVFIPRRPNSVSVVGEVLNTSTFAYKPSRSVYDYIDSAGGLNEYADKSRIFVILPNGQAKLVKRNLFNQSNDILPGSTVVVSRDSNPFDAIEITRIITPILADLATSAAAIAAISDN